MIRRGTVIIAIAGICALIAALAVAFLAHMRQDVEDTDSIVREAQARVMLAAGCNYVLEASRLGWDRNLGNPGTHNEGHGWIDVRTGQPGPLDESRNPVWTDATRFPAVHGRAARCAMAVRARPPFAVQLRVAYNAIPGPEAGADDGKPLLVNPDPQPTVAPGETNSDAVWRSSWRFGDPRPRQTSTGMAWFRCFRDSAAVFTITCGAGGTLGFRDWQDVQDEGAQADFGDQATFESLLAVERRLWYRVEWSAAVAAPDFHLTDNEFGKAFSDATTYGWSWGGPGNAPAYLIDNYYMHPRNSSLASTPARSSRCQIHYNNPVGSIRWVQRLDAAPADSHAAQRW